MTELFNMNLNPDYDPNNSSGFENMISKTKTLERLDFVDAIRQNRNNTWILIISMILLAGIFGYLLGLTYDAAIYENPRPKIGRIYSGTGSWQEIVLAPSKYGIIVAASLGGFMAFWSVLSLWNADKIVLDRTHAVSASKTKYLQLHNIVEEMALAAGIPKPRIVIIPTNVPNAFATGLSLESSVIGVTEGLLNTLDREELQGVIAHEIAHIINDDMRYTTIVAVMTGILVFLSQMIIELRGGIRLRESEKGKGHPIFIVLLLLLFIFAAFVVPIVSKLLQMAVSRQREYLADATAVQLTRNPSGLINALIKIMQNQQAVRELPTSLAPLYIIPPDQMLQGNQSSNLSTHPSLESRIERLKAIGFY